MTQADVNFLQALVESHEQVIAADCKRRKFYNRRVSQSEKRANKILREMMCR